MRYLAVLVLVAGCDAVFQLEDVEPSNTLCLGRNTNEGLFGHCLTAQPRMDLEGVIDIDTDNAEQCTAIVAQADVDRTEVCIVAARTIKIQGAVVAHGPRPLVLAAIESFEVTASGSVSVASHRRLVNGAGANFMNCANQINGRDSTNLSGGCGAAGGSFQTVGGNGGAGNGNPTNVQAVGEPPPGFVRGGCSGGGGGNGKLSLGGGRGIGGGALYAMAGTTMTIAGTLDASGEAGAGGDGGTASMSGGAGGGGGGSGGLLALDSPMIVLEPGAKLIANGGGGGGGGASSQPGKNGFEADWASPFPFVAAGGDGGFNNVGGTGGRGAAADQGAAMGANYSGAGGDAGGGGGGGAGWILMFGDVDDRGAAITPAP